MNTLDKEFVPYQESLELKELGFDEPCFKMSEHRKVCEEQSKPEGCQLHNLHCGYPNCTIDQSITPIPLPTFSQAFRWFREKYGYSHSITQHEIIEGQTDLLYIDESEEFQDIGWLARVEPDFIKIFKTYEEAELACLRKLIEIVKNKN